ncbi:response regulator, partial [Campylobacter gastrosuis]
EAYSNTLQTPYGDVKVFFDLYADNDKLGIGELENNKKLFNFDTNGDGFVNSNDENFSKLKVRGYDKDGNEKIMSLNEATQGRGVDLTKFISQEIINYIQKQIEENNAIAIKENRPDLYIDPDSFDKRIGYYGSNPYTAFAPESRYKKLESSQIDEFFNSYADDDGWVNLNNQTMAGFNNLAYLKAGFDGSVKLSEFNPIVGIDYSKNSQSYGEYQKDSFMKFYSDYKKESKAHEQDVSWLINNLKAYEVDEADELSSKLLGSKSAYMIAMENDFKKATGLSFSLSNLEKVRKLFESDQDKAAASLADSDSVIAIRKNKNGTFTLKFDSGRMIDVNELYSDTGTLLTDKNGTRASINLEAKIMDEITLNKLYFESVGIYDEGRYKTLKEIGAQFIKSVATKHGTQFLITLANNEKISTNELYNIA